MRVTKNFEENALYDDIDYKTHFINRAGLYIFKTESLNYIFGIFTIQHKGEK